MSSVVQTETATAVATPVSFHGVWLPLVTPFHEDGPDLFALRRLMRHYLQTGIDGVVVCGSTGEAAAMDEYEQLAVLDTVLDEAGPLPVVMGLAGNHQREVLRRQAVFTSRPLAGLLTPAPYYVRPGQVGLADYFRALADASAVPLILYDIPYRTGAQIETSTLLALAEHPNIRAIKDCGGSCARRSLRGHVPGHAGAAGGRGASNFPCPGADDPHGLRGTEPGATEGVAGTPGLDA
ncbi:dihydrodipicolinate synthase [Bordetella holmesii]|uniref:Dihydrodipicolinate synthetase domain protein n=2 Tax=Bordetella holmesii TaxID=35814 RepID=A0A158M2D2_9BORD|nr:dihydrodipicolinate synthetase family protein [Bordetella holmesii ATCC 51541]AIT25982.1 dihydrodipicolinate synthetase family protein [Bordetella holmesii 44057]AMD45072.1 dihydrodipicolinate synthase [Bordetella holmesii H558]AOB37165.1 dihydrodipicolinate synthase [Bordetella holmesii]EWM43924.1 dihydrodipicolinate synthetase family protein [Bordetella holmesii 41130]EWM46554.1 dihydrodipicolinate synthetase family protein [Bordetella holmesii 35009]EWM50718.1 dihydrodipicolinate synthe